MRFLQISGSISPTLPTLTPNPGSIPTGDSTKRRVPSDARTTFGTIASAGGSAETASP